MLISVLVGGRGQWYWAYWQEDMLLALVTMSSAFADAIWKPVHSWL
jgi:hypothetical protein